MEIFSFISGKKRLKGQKWKYFQVTQNLHSIEILIGCLEMNSFLLYLPTHWISQPCLGLNSGTESCKMFSSL